MDYRFVYDRNKHSVWDNFGHNVLMGSSTRKSAESGNTAFAFQLFAVLKVLLNYVNEYIKKHTDSSNSLFIVCFKKKPKQANFANNLS